jgi:lipopolysaccharide assembly outer membrane protein LptD (OstA)
MNKIFSIFIFLILLFNYVIRLSANDDTYINTNNIIYNEKGNIIELAENSKINYKNTNLLIDRGIIDYNKNEIEVFGNFYLYEELNILSGENLKGNISLDFFTANNVSFIYNDDLKIDSEKVERERNLVYFYNNFLTPCELDGYFNCPTWSLRIDKTEYDAEQDKFTHFNTFLQIADYKVFYLPYFSHYGAKAPRKMGFLSPTIEFTVGGDQGIITPYYVPVTESTDILFTPKIFLDENFEFIEKYRLNTQIQSRASGGNTNISIISIKDDNDNEINSSFKIETKQIINKNSVFSASGLFTNSVSTTRSNNEDPITFEDIYLRVENYNFIKKDDYLKTELSSVESFETTDLSSIPISPSLNYVNFVDTKNFQIMNNLDFIILKRDNSSVSSPSESFKIKLENEFANVNSINNISIFNKLYVNNSYNEYYFKKNTSLNHNSLKSNLSISSDLYYNTSYFLTPRIKFIIPFQIKNSNKLINEESQSITFNYQNQFSENRFFGNDLFDTSPRTIYGIESSFNIGNAELGFNINQSFETYANNNYANLVNQNSKFSDYALESKLNLENMNFKIDTRLDRNNLSKKEMNYSLNFEKQINLSFIYNETQSESFKNLSNDRQSIIFDLSKKINDNFKFGFTSNLDVKNNYNPYSSELNVSIFDECSNLDITYTNTRFNDNYNTQPKETIGIAISMDYLGFFSYEQSTGILFSEPGN